MALHGPDVTTRGRRARHGYELKQRWDEILGSSRSLQFGQIYATLARLERDGLIELDQREAGHGPERTCYAITEAGRAAVEEWLRAPVAPESVVSRATAARSLRAA